MRKPGLGELNLGALAGAVVGSIGGLFAVGLAPAIILRDFARLFGTPKLGMICWLIAGALGWFIGGQIGPRVADRFNINRAELIGGGLGGLIPVILIALWGWYMTTRAN